MRPLKRIPILVLACLSALLPSGRARAEDTKGKWQFGFGLSYYSTVDFIRSNSDLAIAGEVVGEDGLPAVGSVDERPDINIQNQPSIRDDFKVDFSASYGLTRWLALEAAVSYLNAPVGNIEFFTRNVTQELSGAPTNTLVRSCGPNLGKDCWTYTPQQSSEIKNNKFLTVGTMTEIPIHLSALIRFRPESPFDPYIGMGFGYIMTNLKTSDEFNRTAAFFADPAFRVTAADEGEFTLTNRCRRENGGPCNDFNPGPLEANIRDTWEWHAIGGVDYYMSDRFSVYVDTRYVWTSGAVDIRTDSAHQVRFAVIDEGFLLLKRQGNGTTPYDPENPSSWFLWEDIGVEANRDFQDNVCPKMEDGITSQCRRSGYLETEDKNMSGALDDRCENPDDFCEDIGILYQLLPGSRDVDESLRINCPLCRENGVLDTEDANGNGFLDRFLLYGIDICTTPQGAGNPRCTGPLPAQPSYVWPEGCPQRPDQLAPFMTLTESGCPPFPPVDPETLQRPNVGTTVADNAADTFIVQGGKIRLGGFSLGVGFKFTF